MTCRGPRGARRALPRLRAHAELRMLPPHPRELLPNEDLVRVVVPEGPRAPACVVRGQLKDPLRRKEGMTHRVPSGDRATGLRQGSDRKVPAGVPSGCACKR